MSQQLAERLQNQRGFTLIELLVVILIIGILAAIALPAFLGQRAKGQDSSAKSNARNLVSEMESCFATSQNYTTCAASAKADAGLSSENVAVTSSASDVYTIVATSASKNTFTITRNTAGFATNTCSTTGGTTKGGCSGTSW